MIVIIAGMPRSGSTFSFNIARELLQARGTVAWDTANSLPPASRLAATDHFILKSHHPDPEVLARMAAGEVKALCTYRRPADAIASWAGTFGFSLEDSVGAVRSWIDWHRGQRGRTHDIDYETLERDPLGAILGMQRFLLGSPDAAEAGRLSEAYDKRATFDKVSRMEMDEKTVDLGFSFYDRQTFFHRRHVRSLEPLTAEDTLTPSQLAAVRDALAGSGRAGKARLWHRSAGNGSVMPGHGSAVFHYSSTSSSFPVFGSR